MEAAPTPTRSHPHVVLRQRLRRRRPATAPAGSAAADGPRSTLSLGRARRRPPVPPTAAGRDQPCPAGQACVAGGCARRVLREDARPAAHLTNRSEHRTPPWDSQNRRRLRQRRPAGMTGDTLSASPGLHRSVCTDPLRVAMRHVRHGLRHERCRASAGVRRNGLRPRKPPSGGGLHLWRDHSPWRAMAAPPASGVRLHLAHFFHPGAIWTHSHTPLTPSILTPQRPLRSGRTGLHDGWHRPRAAASDRLRVSISWRQSLRHPRPMITGCSATVPPRVRTAASTPSPWLARARPIAVEAYDIDAMGTRKGPAPPIRVDLSVAAEATGCLTMRRGSME